MAKFLGFGNGVTGVFNNTVSSTWSLPYGNCSGTASTNTITTVNMTSSFSIGDMIMILQMRGGTLGAYEINKITNVSGSTVTVLNPLDYTYVHSTSTNISSAKCQITQVPQYSQVNISANLKAPNWDKNKGGIIAMVCNGQTYVTNGARVGVDGGTGIYNNTGAGAGGTTGGYPGGYADTHEVGIQSQGGTGVSEISESYGSYFSNGTAGGGGRYFGSSPTDRGAGGGGGHLTVGGNGNKTGSADYGRGGTAIGDATLQTIHFGGAGGGGGGANQFGAGGGGAGGGLVLIFTKDLYCSDGYISANGGDIQGSPNNPEGGTGAGGTVFLRGLRGYIGSNRITTNPGTGTTSGSGSAGGNGSFGRTRLEFCELIGSSSTATVSTGGYDYCASSGVVFF